MAVALPPFDIWPVAFVGLVPLGVAACREGVTRHRAVAGGLWFGGLFYGIVLHWVPFTLSGILPFGFLLGCLAIAVLVCTCGVQLMAVHELVAGRAVLALLAFPAVWITSETLIAHAGTLAMPWSPLGLALAGTPTLAGLAEWGGVRGLGLWITLVNGSLVAIILSPHGWRKWFGAIGVLGITLGPMVLGVARDRGLRTTSLPPILLTQIHLTREVLRDPDLRDQRVGEMLEQVLEPWRSGGGPTDRARPSFGNEDPVVVLLPEAPFRQEWNSALRGRIGRHARDLGVPVLVGAHVRGLPPSDSDRLLNAVMLVEPGGEARMVHAKLRLVPGVENPGFARGAVPGVIQLAGLNMGFAICFESAFGRDAASARGDGAQVLINPTNDGWFAPHLGGVRSAGHAQHRAHLILRATESRMTAVRSSVGGELLAIGPDGRVKVRGAVGQDGAAVVIPAVGPTTAFVRYGDIGGGTAVSLLGVLMMLRIAGLREREDDRVEP